MTEACCLVSDGWCPVSGFSKNKSHYLVFLGVRDPGQTPPKPWEDVETNT